MTSACSQGHVAAVKRLLDWGVDPNLNDSNSGFSPLQIAVRIEDIELVRLLLACGAISNDSVRVGAAPFLTT
jgi:ankyrin repeat protein